MSDSDVVIRVEGLGKTYAIHHEKAERYTALRDVVARQAKAAGRLLNPFTLAGQLHKAQREATRDRADSEEKFWALQDVSFEIRRGERVGIIGRNGAGKSTLLKILSRITEPTTGRVEIRGRVASLLEVGTGFHPELTGRENIYLNGAILGMTRREVRAKFDEMVDFAEVERFLDTPVKRYSSGMYVRLAFAVAAHLEPEILVVDEVLAVGDASFQKKCLGKMGEISEHEVRTILLVSHQMNMITKLCSRCMVLSAGHLTLDSDTPEAAVSHYLGTAQAGPQTEWQNSQGAYSDREVVPLSLSIHALEPPCSSGAHGPMEITGNFENATPLQIAARFSASGVDLSMNVGVAIYNSEGQLLLWSFTSDTAEMSWPPLQEGANTLRVTIPAHYFNEGSYRVELLASYHMKKFIIAPGEGPQIGFGIQGGLSQSPHWIQARPGIMAPIWQWVSGEAISSTDSAQN